MRKQVIDPASADDGGRVPVRRHGLLDHAWQRSYRNLCEEGLSAGEDRPQAQLFEHYAVSLWMPEVGGQVDWHAEDHEQTMVALGLSSKREITRTRVRVRTAMAAQRLEQGRYLGGRPPYGYRAR